MGKSQQAAETAASGEDEAPGTAQQRLPEKRLNLTRFLQEKPQDSGVRVLLNAKYRTAVKSLAEWEAALTELLGKKTK
ncbi:hypothetical protein FACS1894151_10690 [Spirochaetia bacterium]|nr:hypothetical protein FACS1894151_10690 [Spirochaetia bacterium]